MVKVNEFPKKLCFRSENELATDGDRLREAVAYFIALTTLTAEASSFVREAEKIALINI